MQGPLNSGAQKEKKKEKKVLSLSKMGHSFTLQSSVAPSQVYITALDILA